MTQGDTRRHKEAQGEGRKRTYNRCSVFNNTPQGVLVRLSSTLFNSLLFCNFVYLDYIPERAPPQLRQLCKISAVPTVTIASTRPAVLPPSAPESFECAPQSGRLEDGVLWVRGGRRGGRGRERGKGFRRRI